MMGDRWGFWVCFVEVGGWGCCVVRVYDVTGGGRERGRGGGGLVVI